jgi:hypothetical protein
MGVGFCKFSVIFFSAILGMFLLSACAQTATTPAPATLTDVNDIEMLRLAFNQDAGKPRLILLGAPT